MGVPAYTRSRSYSPRLSLSLLPTLLTVPPRRPAYIYATTGGQYRMHEEHRRCVRCNSGGGDGGNDGAPRPVRRPADLDTDIEGVRERARSWEKGERRRGGRTRARSHVATRERFMGETSGTTRTSSRDPLRRAALRCRRRRRRRYSGTPSERERERESPT